MNAPNLAILPTQTKSTKTNPDRPKAYTQAVHMQDMALKDALNPKTSARDRAQVMRAWDVLEERKRILRMKPKPKDIDVSSRPKKSGRATPFAPPTDAPTSTPAKASPQTEPGETTNSLDTTQQPPSQ